MLISGVLTAYVYVVLVSFDAASSLYVDRYCLLCRLFCYVTVCHVISRCLSRLSSVNIIVCAVRISPPDWLARVVLMLLYRSKVDENYPLLTRLTFSKCSRTGTSQEHQMMAQLARSHWFVPVMYSLSQGLSDRGDVVHVTT